MTASETKKKKANIDTKLRQISKIHKQRLGLVGPYCGMALILTFPLVLLPLYLFLLVFNVAYFWIRRQKRIDPKLYINFDRHDISHLRFADKVWCDYCEWANGSLQWALAITNELERRYCPIKNQNHAGSGTRKSWREKFLDYDHEPDDLERYYDERYLQESKLDT